MVLPVNHWYGKFSKLASLIVGVWPFGLEGLWLCSAMLRCKILSLPFHGLRQGGGRGAQFAIWQQWSEFRREELLLNNVEHRIGKKV